MPNTKSRVLHVLSTNEGGLSERQVVAALRPRGELSFAEEVEHSTQISRALSALKHEHRAWPTTKAGTQRWNITDKGRRKH
jgi:hypothetical protein